MTLGNPVLCCFQKSGKKWVLADYKRKIKFFLDRWVNNLRYADDTTRMAEREEELKSLLMKVIEEKKERKWKRRVKKLA